MDADAALAACRAELAAAGDAAAVAAVKSKWLGKRGPVADALAGIGGLAGAERAAAGKAANALRAGLEAAVAERLAGLEGSRTSAVAAALAREAALPPVLPRRGRLHPLERVMREALAIFRSMGYETVVGPEMETEENNFDALNIGPDHPARGDLDSFYLTNGQLLRTHTSPMQVRVLRERPPPLRVVVPGRVYRRETDDRTHASVFHQIEGLLVDREVAFSDLKGILASFCRHLFGAAEIRFRPDYFPFTEPSAEVAVRVEGKWLELMGCGMVHPHVLAHVGLDPDEWQGLAFGMGVDRLAMVRYGIPDVRLLLEGGPRFLQAF